MRWNVLGVLLFSALCWEMIVRFFVVSPAVVRFDSELGPMKAPFSYILRTYEGYSRFVTDRYGFNNDVMPAVMPTHRILVLGDSFVEAEQVMRRDNFVSRLNQLPDVLAYNAGYSGADPRAFPVLMDRFFQRLHPTEVVVCVNGDDLNELNTFRLPHYPTPTGLKAWLQPVFAYSALATHLNWKYKPILTAWWHEFFHGVDTKHQQSSKDMFETHLQHWQDILSYLQQKHVPLLLLVMPNIRYTQHGVERVASKNITGMVQVAKQLGIPAIETSKAFVRDYAHTRQVALGFANSYFGEGHLNAHGHRIVAKEVMKALHLKP